ncbi:potassium transporter TrkG [Streptomyces sp. NPDC086554]|uniref:potassium transporter TrkG n=1 Tax=Streptomyces sp. NPDC086554 TaxID=3154864 RepID=UPI003448D437
MTRTAGFNSLDIGAMHASTLLMSCMLMFIGGGSAGTAGGIKVTTFAVLAAAIAAEVRGERASVVMRRALSPHVLRQARSSASAVPSRPASWSHRTSWTRRSPTSGPRPSADGTARSSNGSARTMSCCPSTRWASASPTTAETVVERGDVVVVTGRIEAVEAFAALS